MTGPRQPRTLECELGGWGGHCLSASLGALPREPWPVTAPKIHSQPLLHPRWAPDAPGSLCPHSQPSPAHENTHPAYTQGGWVTCPGPLSRSAAGQDGFTPHSRPFYPTTSCFTVFLTLTMFLSLELKLESSYLG